MLVKPPSGNPNVTTPPDVFWVNWLMYRTSFLNRLNPPVMFRSNRNGSVNDSV